MTDMFSRKRRSEIMSNIRSKDTKAEKVVFKYLRKEKVYFQKHYDRLYGKPDIALPRKKKAVFIDGDFWHGRNAERLARSDNSEYWTKKIAGNVERDKIVDNNLHELGWQFLRVWETDINRKRTQQGELERIAKFLKN